MMSCLRRWSGWGDKTGPGSDRAVFSRCFAVCQGGGLVIPRSATRSHSCFRYLPGCDVRVRPGRSRADFEFRNHRRVSPADKLVPRRGTQPKLSPSFANVRRKPHYPLKTHTIPADLSAQSFVGIRQKPPNSVGTNEGLAWVSSLR